MKAKPGFLHAVTIVGVNVTGNIYDNNVAVPANQVLSITNGGANRIRRFVLDCEMVNGIYVEVIGGAPAVTVIWT